jgi:hypothetical protein
MESPDSVSRVTAPKSAITKIIPQQIKSQQVTAGGSDLLGIHFTIPKIVIPGRAPWREPGIQLIFPQTLLLAEAFA